MSIETPEGVANLQENEHPAKPLAAAFAKEFLHEGDAFFFEDPFCERGFWVKGPVRGEGIVDAPAVAVLVIIGAKNDAADLAPVEGAGAHEAGFDGDVDSGIGEVFAAEEVESGCEGDDLRVRGAVVEPFCLVVAAGDDLVVEDDDGADGDLFFGVGFAGFLEGLLHEVFVGHHNAKIGRIRPI